MDTRTRHLFFAAFATDTAPNIATYIKLLFILIAMVARIHHDDLRHSDLIRSGAIVAFLVPS